MTATTVPVEYLPQLIEEAERYLALLEDMYAGLRDGTYTWRDWDPDYVCLDKQEAAVDECGIAMDSARRDLEALQAEAARRAQDTEWGNAS